MLEQAETGEGRGVAIVSLKLALSQEARQSLAAVRVAQESAQRRARRQTMQARIGVVLLAGAVVAGAISWGPRLGQWRRSRVHVAKALPTPTRTSTPSSNQASKPASKPDSTVAPKPAVVAAPPAPVVQPASAAQLVTAKPAAIVQAPARSVPLAVPLAAAVVAPEKAAADGVPAEGCDTSTRRGLWRRSPEACARAFAADPNNASLAL